MALPKNPKKAPQGAATPNNDTQVQATADSAASAKSDGLNDQDRELAQSVRDFVFTNGLAANLGERDRMFVNVEGWQYAGHLIGLRSVVQEVKRIFPGEPDEIKYWAGVQLVETGGHVVGYGAAICSSKESSRTSQHEFAVCAMAQTRATGRAFRNSIGWVMAAAGFATTTREEMEFTAAAQGPPSTPAPAPVVQEDPGYADNTPQPAPAEPTPQEATEGPKRPGNAALKPEKDSPEKEATKQVNASVASLKHTQANPATMLQGKDLKPTGKEGQIIDASKELSADNRYADLDQKAQIIDLLTKPYFTNAERSKMLLNIHKLSAATATDQHGKIQTEYENRKRLNPSLEQ